MTEGQSRRNRKASAKARKPKLLCVDDEREILSALQRSLRQKADRILTATSGEEGLALLEEYAPGVIVSDMRMPGMNGTEFLNRVLEFAPHAFRILLTGHADMEAAISAINKGEIHRYLHKPWDADELGHAIEQGEVLVNHADAQRF